MNLYFGIVEDVADPREIGRVRVRVFGIHNEDIKKVPVETLPWATCMFSSSDASSSGIGESNNLVPGSKVIVSFAENDEYKQSPIVLGSIKSLPSRRLINKGFTDPNGGYPKVSESTDVPEEATSGWRDSVSAKAKHEARKENIPTARNTKSSSMPWDMPDEFKRRKTIYGKNRVTKTEGGSVSEKDSTPGFERNSEFHPSGTFETVYANGDKVINVVGDDFEIILKDKRIYVKGDCSLTVSGDMRTLVEGDNYLEVLGNSFETIHGNKELCTNNYICTHNNIGISASRREINANSTYSGTHSFSSTVNAHISGDAVYANSAGEATRSETASSLGTGGKGVPSGLSVGAVSPENLSAQGTPNNPISYFEDFEVARREYQEYSQQFAEQFLNFENNQIQEILESNKSKLLEAIRKNTSIYKLESELFNNKNIRNREVLLACAAKTLKEHEIMGIALEKELSRSQVFRENERLAQQIFEFVGNNSEKVENYLRNFHF